MKTFSLKTFSLKTLILSTCCILLFNNCSNDEPEKNKLNDNNSFIVNSKLSLDEIKDVYNNIIKIDDTDEQVLAASTLSPEEKLALWEYKLQNFKSNNNLNQAQNDFVNELLSVLTEKHFVAGSAERTEFLNNLSSNYMSRARDLFGQNEGWYLLTKVENINHRIDRFNNNNGSINVESGGIRACNCEPNDTCARINSVSVWGIGWEYGRCGGGCYVREYFWGLWESDDTGRCNYN